MTMIKLSWQVEPIPKKAVLREVEDPQSQTTSLRIQVARTTSSADY